VDQAAHDLGDARGVAAGVGRAPRRAQVEAAELRARSQLGDHAAGDGGQVDALVAQVDAGVENREVEEVARQGAQPAGLLARALATSPAWRRSTTRAGRPPTDSGTETRRSSPDRRSSPASVSTSTPRPPSTTTRAADRRCSSSASTRRLSPPCAAANAGASAA